MNILVSACLLGIECKYNGGANPHPLLMEAAGRGDVHLIPICPECFGGLPIPRLPSEIRNGRVYAKDGRDVTEAFERGARAALHTARVYGCTAAILKERSPSCGSGLVYDGSFTGSLAPGDGVAARLLKENGIAVYGESQAAQVLASLSK